MDRWRIDLLTRIAIHFADGPRDVPARLFGLLIDKDLTDLLDLMESLDSSSLGVPDPITLEQAAKLVKQELQILHSRQGRPDPAK